MISFALICFIIPTPPPDLKISDFRPPSYKIFTAALSADFDKYYYQDFIEFRATGGPKFQSINDTTELYILGGISGCRDWSLADFHLESYFSIRHYLFASSLFLRCKLLLFSYNYLWLHNTPRIWENHKRGYVDLGTGLGHLREGRFTAQALHINELLLKERVIDKNLSNRTIMELARAISKRRFYLFKHERYEKYFYRRIEEVITSDPISKKPIPIYVWFKIYEIINKAYYYNFAYDYQYWSRKFGTRFSIDFKGKDINKYSGEDAYKKFPFFNTYYYEPSICFKFEYENPIDLRRQISIISSYSISWFETATCHTFGSDLCYGYGIIDFILIEGQIGAYYYYTVPKDSVAEGSFVLKPRTEISYYIEDFIEISLSGNIDFSIAKAEGTERKWGLYTNPSFGLDINWRIF